MSELTAPPMHPAGIPAPAALCAAECERSVSMAASLSSRLPSLDGWRAFSILLVLGSHTVYANGISSTQEDFFHRWFDGHLGVRFFFVISGFLITWLMQLEQNRTGSVCLRTFYARRALRILPVYGAFLAVLAGLQLFTPFHQSAQVWLGNLTFTTNFLGNSHPTSHLWSLAVEEQFYLVWPALFVFFKPHEKGTRMADILAFSFSLAIANRLIWSQAPESPLLRSLFSEWSFFNNADSLCLGCVMAILLMRHPAPVRFLILGRPFLLLGSGAALIIIPEMMTWVLSQHLLSASLTKILWAAQFCLGRSLQSIGFGLVMLQSVLSPRWGLYRLLNNSAVCQIGILSYSIYIWQQLFCTKTSVFGMQSVWWMSHLFWLLPVLAVGVVSYHGLERPLLKLRHRFR